MYNGLHQDMTELRGPSPIRMYRGVFPWPVYMAEYLCCHHSDERECEYSIQCEQGGQLLGFSLDIDKTYTLCYVVFEKTTV